MKPMYESDGSAIAAHADGSSEKGGGDRQANPQTRTDEEMERREHAWWDPLPCRVP